MACGSQAACLGAGPVLPDGPRLSTAPAAAPDEAASTGNDYQLIVMPSGRTWLLPFALEDADEGEHRRPGAGDAPICARARPASGSHIAMPAHVPASISSLIYKPAVALFGKRR